MWQSLCLTVSGFVSCAQIISFQSSVPRSCLQTKYQSGPSGFAGGSRPTPPPTTTKQHTPAVLCHSACLGFDMLSAVMLVVLILFVIVLTLDVSRIQYFYPFPAQVQWRNSWFAIIVEAFVFTIQIVRVGFEGIPGMKCEDVCWGAMPNVC